ncbi:MULTISPECIES: hypothetical protein, partial [unclassified Microcoleus]|uniref:hypothetical protein n=1 Tax=unclassified Microcoleus TaxID=2642155 RepID=UPI002FCEE529
CFFDGMGIYFRGYICSRTLGIWYYSESVTPPNPKREIHKYLLKQDLVNRYHSRSQLIRCAFPSCVPITSGAYCAIAPAAARSATSCKGDRPPRICLREG